MFGQSIPENMMTEIKNRSAFFERMKNAFLKRFLYVLSLAGERVVSRIVLRSCWGVIVFVIHSGPL